MATASPEVVAEILMTRKLSTTPGTLLRTDSRCTAGHRSEQVSVYSRRTY